MHQKELDIIQDHPYACWIQKYTDTMHVIENGRCSECVRVGLAEDGEYGRLGAL